VALKITREFNPTLRVAGSDGLDFYRLSRFSKNPVRAKSVTLQHEIDMWQAGQREWKDASPEATIFYLIGNHEDRLRRWIWDHDEFAELDALELYNLLGFPKLGIPWNKEKGEEGHRELDLGALLIEHGRYVRKYSAYTAKAHIEEERHARSIVHGHTHRGGSYLTRTRDRIIQAQECFCLCRLDPEYVRNPNWQQGIVLAEIVDDIVTIEAVPFHQKDNKTLARWRGKEYTSDL
jgi:hypothetical protein